MLLLYHEYWVLTRTPPSIQLLPLYHGDPEALDLQDWPFYPLQQFTYEVDIRVGQLKAWVAAELVSLPARPHPHHQGELSSTAPASLPNASLARGWASCPSLGFSRAAHQLSHYHSQFYCAAPLPIVLQLAGAWDRSPTLMPSRLVL